MASHASNSVERDALRERERLARALLLEEKHEPHANPIFAQPIRVEPGLEDAMSLRIRNTLGEFNQLKPYLISDPKNLIGVSRSSSISVPPATAPQPPPPSSSSSSSSQGATDKQRLVANAMAILDKKKALISAATAPPLNGQRKNHGQNDSHNHRTTQQKTSKSQVKRPSSSSSGPKVESKPLLVNGNLSTLSGQADGVKGSSNVGQAPPQPSRRPTTPPPTPAKLTTPQKVKVVVERDTDEEEEADTAVESILQEMKLGIPTPLTAIETPRLEDTRFHFSPHKHQNNTLNQCEVDAVTAASESRRRHQYSDSTNTGGDRGDGRRRTNRPSPAYKPQKTDILVSDSEEEFQTNTAPNGSVTDTRLQVLPPLGSPVKATPYSSSQTESLVEGRHSPKRFQHLEKQCEEGNTESATTKNASASAEVAEAKASSSSSSSESSSSDGSSSEDEDDGKPSTESSPERGSKPLSWSLQTFMNNKNGSGLPALSKPEYEPDRGPDPSLVDVDSVNCLMSKNSSHLDDCFSPLLPSSVESGHEEEKPSNPTSSRTNRGTGYKDSCAPSTPGSPVVEALRLSPSSSPSNTPPQTSSKPLPKSKSSLPEKRPKKKKVGRPPGSAPKGSSFPPKESHRQTTVNQSKVKSRELVETSSSSEQSDNEADEVRSALPVPKIVQTPTKKKSKTEKKPSPPVSSVKSSSSTKKEKKDSTKSRPSLSVLGNCADPEAKSNSVLPVKPPVKVVVIADEKECKENVVPQVLVSIQLHCLERVPPYPPQGRALLRPEDSVIRQRTKRPHSPPPAPPPPPHHHNHRHNHYHQRLKKDCTKDISQRPDKSAVSKSSNADAGACDRVEHVFGKNVEEEEIIKNKLKKGKRKGHENSEERDKPSKKKPKKEKENEFKRENSASRSERSPCGSLVSVSSSVSSHYSRSLHTSSSSKKEKSSKSDRSKERRPRDLEGNTPQAESFIKEPHAKDDRNLTESIRCKEEKLKEDPQSKSKEEIPKEEIQSKNTSRFKEEHLRVKEEHSRSKEEQLVRNKEEQHVRPKEEHLRIKEEQHARSKEEQHVRTKEEHSRIKEEQHSRIKEEQHSRSKEEQHARTKEEQHARTKEEQHARTKEEPHVRTKEEQHARTKEEQHVRTKEEPHVRTKEEQHVRNKEEQNVRTKEEQNVRTKEEQNVRTKEEQNVRTKEEQNVRTKEEQNVRTKEEQHVRTKEEQHARTKEEQHSRNKEEQHSRNKEEQHARTKEEQHARTKEEQHVRTKEEQHVRTKEEQHARTKEEQHARTKEEQHARTKEEQRMRTKEEQYVRTKEEQHVRTKEEHARIKEEQQARTKEEQRVRSKEEQHVRNKEEQYIKEDLARSREDLTRNKEEQVRVKEEHLKDESVKSKEERGSSKEGRSKNDRCKGKEERSRERAKAEKTRSEEPVENNKVSRSLKESSEKKGAKRREERMSTGSNSGSSSKHKSKMKDGGQSQSQQQQIQAPSNQSERKGTSKGRDSNWEQPTPDTGNKASTSQESSGGPQSIETSSDTQPHVGLHNGAHPATPTDCTLNNNSSSHHAWEYSSSSKIRSEGDSASRASIEYDTRQHSSDYYMQEAKRLKHQADKEPDRTVQAMKYLEAVLYFIMTGNAMEHARVDTDKVYTMYQETLNLIKHISSKFQKIQHSSAGSTDNKLTILSLRCQSLLYLKLYYLRKPEVKDLQKDLSDFHKSPAGKMASSQKSPVSSQLQQPSNQQASSSSSRCRLQQPSPHGKCIPSSPHSPTPSPAGSVASVGSQSSGYSSSELTGCATARHSCSNGLVVSIPQTVYGMMQRHSSHLGNLQTCHDLWEQADYLMHRSHSKEFFTQLDAECTRLTLHSSVADLLFYVRRGLSILKGAA